MDKRIGDAIGECIMSDDEILELAALMGNEPTDAELIDFARAIEQRTLTNQKARWYQIGAEAERHDIAKMVEHEKEVWDTPIYVRERLDTVAAKIRARGE